MLLESFSEELRLAQELKMIDLGNLATSISQSFIVEIRVALATSERALVTLPSVGVITWNGFQCEFEPGGFLKKDVTEHEFFLEKFLINKWGESEAWRPLNFDRFARLSQPVPGLPLLTDVASSILQVVSRGDPELRRLLPDDLLSAMCFTIHDAICSGAGIDLETIGCFVHLRFEPDIRLLKSVKAMRSKSAKENVSNLKASCFSLATSTSDYYRIQLPTAKPR